MQGFNRVMLIGNATRDAVTRGLPNGTVVAEFGLASNRKWKSEAGEEREETTFVDVEAFGRQAEVLGEYLTKGRPIFIEGRLRYSTWDDKNGGGKRSKISVVLENFQFLGGGDRGEDRGDDGQGIPPASKGGKSSPAPVGPGGPRKFGDFTKPAEVARQARAQKANVDPPFGEEQQFKESDIPFPSPHRLRDVVGANKPTSRT